MRKTINLEFYIEQKYLSKMKANKDFFHKNKDWENLSLADRSYNLEYDLFDS